MGDFLWWSGAVMWAAFAIVGATVALWFLADLFFHIMTPRLFTAKEFGAFLMERARKRHDAPERTEKPR